MPWSVCTSRLRVVDEPDVGVDEADVARQRRGDRPDDVVLRRSRTCRTGGTAARAGRRAGSARSITVIVHCLRSSRCDSRLAVSAPPVPAPRITMFFMVALFAANPGSSIPVPAGPDVDLGFARRTPLRGSFPVATSVPHPCGRACCERSSADDLPDPVRERTANAPIATPPRAAMRRNVTPDVTTCYSFTSFQPGPGSKVVIAMPMAVEFRPRSFS